MLSSVRGILVDVAGGTVNLSLGGCIELELLVPAFTAIRLAPEPRGGELRLRTFLFLESQGQGTSFVPRLAGFESGSDQRFFELFTSVKGIGYRKGLRSLALPPARIAEAVDRRDVALLQTLPEVGKRTAESIVLGLKDKVAPFLGEAPSAAAAVEAAAGAKAAPADAAAGAGSDEIPVGGGGGSYREALEALVQLGEPRAEAAARLEQAMSRGGEVGSVGELIARVYELKAAGA